MQIPLQIHYRGVPHSEALDAKLHERAARLERFHPGIVRCRVVVEQKHRHKHQGREFTVTVDVHVPGREIHVGRDHHEDVYVALRDAFDAAERQLEDFVREQRGDVKSHAPLQQGRIARLMPEEGYGFIATEDGREFYFARENVVEPAFERLVVGDRVHFLEDYGAEGRQAKRVTAPHRR